MSIPIFIADSASVFVFANPAFGGNFPHIGGGVTSPSVAAPPLYSFELDTADIRLATGGGTNDTLTMGATSLTPPPHLPHKRDTRRYVIIEAAYLHQNFV